MERTDVDIENEDFIDVVTPDVGAQAISDITSNRATLCAVEDTNSLPDDMLGKPPEIDYDSIGEFCFESDELALKGNTDYKNLLEAMVVLEAQKAKAIKDLERLKKLQEEALSDPFEFLERLKRKENMNFPEPQKIYPIPVIDWSKYAVCGNPSAFCQRQMTLISTKVAQDLSRSKTKYNLQSNESASTNRPWSAEEEKQLRDLFIEFSADENETERWERISSCLENRTPIEVATKARLHALGIEDKKQCHVPGALKNRNCDEENAVYSEIDILENMEISPDLHDSPEFQELVLLNKVLREKLDSTSLSRHMGYKCCRCKAEPIVGVRWHCIDCKLPLSTDFCNDCKDCLYETRQHTANHRVERIHASKTFLDRDYMQFIGSDYNYLDPNYMPAA